MKNFVLLGLLGLGCAAPAQDSAPAPPADEPSANAPLDGDTKPQSTVAAAETAQPIPTEINARYEEQANASKWAKRFESEGREAFDNRDAIVELVGLEPQMTVADIGTGSGLFAMAFAEKVPQGGVIAVDVQDYFLDHVRERAAKDGVENMKFVKAGQRTAGLEPSSIDVAFMCDVFHHVEFPRQYLASLFEAVRPGGRLIVIDFIAKAGVSKPWILEHVRAAPEAFRGEFEEAGFVFSKDHDLLSENFFYVFTKPQ